MLNLARAADRERATVEIDRLETLLTATRRVAVIKDQLRFHDDRYRKVNAVLQSDLTDAEQELARLIAIAPDDWASEIVAAGERSATNGNGDPYNHRASSETDPAAPPADPAPPTPAPDAPAQPANGTTAPAPEPAPAQPADPPASQP